MSRYEPLAPFYDSLTEDVDYEAVLAYYEKIFEIYGVKPKLILDLACGTGSLTWLMAEHGYETIGVDVSAEMLAEATGKEIDDNFSGIAPVFINQPLEELDMYGTADAAVCCLDGINYISPDDIREVFRRLNLFIEDGGVLIFDINSPYKLKWLDGQMFIDETDDVFCVWRTEFDEVENLCFYGMDIFVRDDDDRWTRSCEEHVEYCYEPEILKGILEKAGFTDVRIFGNMRLDAPKKDEHRIFISAMNRR